MKLAHSLWQMNYRQWLIRNRPPQNYRPTDCQDGFSMWHLCALGLVENHVIGGFLQSAGEEEINVLLDDLRESTWRPLPVYMHGWVGELHGMELAVFNRHFMYRSVRDLCRMTGVPIAGYWGIPDEDLPHVVLAFNASLNL